LCPFSTWLQLRGSFDLQISPYTYPDQLDSWAVIVGPQRLRQRQLFQRLKGQAGESLASTPYLVDLIQALIPSAADCVPLFAPHGCVIFHAFSILNFGCKKPLNLHGDGAHTGWTDPTELEIDDLRGDGEGPTQGLTNPDQATAFRAIVCGDESPRQFGVGRPMGQSKATHA
jgi:hypothetical protein